MELSELLAKLSSLPGPSGAETAVTAFAAEYLRPFADEVKTDVMGNVLARRRCGVPGAASLLLDAHIDEVGLVITAAEGGFLRFAAVGGLDERVLPAAEVELLTAEGPLFGVIDTMPPHVLKPEEMEKAPKIETLCIDVGLTQEEAQRLAPPGTVGVFHGPLTHLGAEAVSGRAMDDRSCCAIILKAFEELSQRTLAVDLCLQLSTQEEVGLRGAGPGGFAADADYTIVVDVTFDKTTDGKRVTTALGKGPAIGLGPNCDRRMADDIIRVAQAEGIPYQIEVLPGMSGTNAEVLQVVGSGSRTAVISLPIRYMHTPVETLRMGDMAAVTRLITAYAAALEG